MTHPKTSVPWGHEPSAQSWNAWHGAGAFAKPPANDLYAPRAQFGEYRDHFLGGRLPSGPSVNTLLPIVGQPVGPSLLNCVIYPGSKGDAVSQLQQFLNGRLDPSPGIPDDGFYDEPTLVAVKAFQKASGIEANGHVAAKTWFKLLFGGRVPWKDERPKTQARPRSSAKQPVAGWAVKDKFDVVMIKCGLQLPGDLRFTFQQVVDYGTRQGLAVILTTWAGALLTNGNEATDFGLRALMMGQIGVESLDVIEDFNSCLVATSNATQQVHLEHAATYMARVVTRTGVNLFLALVHRIATKHDAKRDEARPQMAPPGRLSGREIDMRVGMDTPLSKVAKPKPSLVPSECDVLAAKMDELSAASLRASLANDVYERYDPDREGPPPEPPSGFTRLSQHSDKLREMLGEDLSDAELKNLLEPEGSSYRAEIYQDPAGKVFLVFRGTENKEGSKDWIENGLQGAGMQSAHFEEAKRLAIRLKKAVGTDGMEIVGHSKGGGMAAAAGMVTGARTTTFNPSGVHPNTVPDADPSKASNVSTYVVDGEVLNWVQDNRNVVRGALGAAALAAAGPLGGVGALLATQNSLPQANGRRTALPAVWKEGERPAWYDPVMYRVTLHGMPKVQQGIDQLSAQTLATYNRNGCATSHGAR